MVDEELRKFLAMYDSSELAALTKNVAAAMLPQRPATLPTTTEAIRTRKKKLQREKEPFDLS